MRLKKKKKTKHRMMAFRVNDQEHNKLKIKANLYTDGNLSEWLIYASMNYKPTKEEVE